MKKTFIMTAVLAASMFTGGGVFAQNPQITLPSAGLTPDSPFYFLDRLGENLREFFTFNPEAKVKLQIEFAGERIAEIKVMVDKKEPETKGIEKAKLLLIANVASAAEIVSKEKASGKDVTALAKDIDDQFGAREKLLAQTFLDAREKLIAEHKEIKEKLLKDAVAAGDTVKIAALTEQLDNIQNKAADLKDKKDEIKNSFRDEQKKIEQEMDQEDRQKKEQEQDQEDEREENQEGDQGESELNQNGEQGKHETEKKGSEGVDNSQEGE